MVDPTVMTDDPTVITVGRIGTIGIETETGLIETIGHTATIISTIGMTIPTIVRGADLGIIPDITVAGTTTTWKITRVDSL